ncbi:MAG: zinc-ribbon domain-containing protein [Anaerolineae bacterium]
MECPHCYHINRDTARFCAGCGNPLTPDVAQTYVVLQPGRVLRNPYRVVRAIGKGGMGALYLVEDMGAFGRLRVIKVNGSLEDGHTWWQVRLPDSTAGWAAEEWLQPAR